MTTKSRPLTKLKDFFQSKLLARQQSDGQALAAVVYRRFQGQLRILLLQDKKGVWSIPNGRIQAGESAPAAIKRIVTQDSGLRELQIWQTLGNIAREPARSGQNTDPYQCFLIQVPANDQEFEVDKKWRSAVWLASEEVLARIGDQNMAQMVLIAVAKLKRAQI